MSYRDRFPAAAEALVRAGAELAAEGWVPATSGNFSMRLDDEHAAITVSGRHKGRMTTADIMCVDLDGNPVDSEARPSAETVLHTRLYRRFAGIGAVLHTHSPNATVISRHRPGGVRLEGYELLKAFRGIDTHDCAIDVPVFPNDQDIPRLADAVDRWLHGLEDAPGYLIAGHGLYTWGRDLAEAMRHVEAFEFLFQCELKQEA